MIDALIWLITNMAMGFVNFFAFVFNPANWPNFADNESLIRFIYYGASKEFFFVLLDAFLVLLVVGLFKRNILWGFVRGAEAINNTIGRIAAWVLLLMVLQQVLIVALQRIFRVSDITIAPFGFGFTKDVSWFSEELKLYNAIIVSLCVGYTFIQGGHVRVDLIYSSVSHKTKRLVDMFGALVFMIPFVSIVWLFGWFFMWRHLVRPPLASNFDLDRMLRVSKVLKWDVETIGFSPNGFNGYFLFKVLLVMFAGLLFLQAVSYFYRSLLEYLEGPESAEKYLDRDSDREREAMEKYEMLTGKTGKPSS